MARQELLPVSKLGPKEKIYRVRRYSGYKDGANFYHHADIVAKTQKEALKAARNNRITNWRRIDTFDTSDRNYRNFEVLCRINDINDAKNLTRPLPRRLRSKV